MRVALELFAAESASRLVVAAATAADRTKTKTNVRRLNTNLLPS
jgi:hypothetical protein